MSSSIKDDIKLVTDNQFIADMQTLNNVLFEASLTPEVYDKFIKNPTRELDILIGNAGLLFNNSRIMNSIVAKKISGYYLWDRLYIWKYYESCEQ